MSLCYQNTFDLYLLSRYFVISSSSKLDSSGGVERDESDPLVLCSDINVHGEELAGCTVRRGPTNKRKLLISKDKEAP
jgi:hypothetical protein